MQKKFLIKNEVMELTLQDVIGMFTQKFAQHFITVYVEKGLTPQDITKRCLFETQNCFEKYDILEHEEARRLFFRYMQIGLDMDVEKLNVHTEYKPVKIAGVVTYDSFENILKRFEPMCIKFSKKYFFDGYEVEDVKQVCYMELYRAYEDYDVTRELEFNTVAYKYIKLKLNNMLRDTKYGKRDTQEFTFIELTQPLGGSSEGYTYLESIPDETTNVEEQVINSSVIELIHTCLTEEEKHLLPVIMGLKTQKQYSQECGISAVAGNKRVKKLELKLQTLIKVA